MIYRLRNMRRHKRFKLNLYDLSSKMSLIGEVEILDISVVGVAVKADRKLNIGKEYMITLKSEGKHIKMNGVVVRSELSGIEERVDRGEVTVYSAGILLKDESADKMKHFLDSIDDNKKSQLPVQPSWYYSDIRFTITTPDEKVLTLPTQFGVKDISQSGVIIITDHQLKIDSMVLMELSVSSCNPVSFMGKVVSCRKKQNKGLLDYEIGVEFSDLTDQDRLLLISFIDCLKERK